MSRWTFLTNHCHVFFLICSDPDVRIRDMAKSVQITERAVQSIIHDLVEDGYLVITKEGRRNHYAPQLHQHLRHPLESGITIRQLIAALQTSHN